MDKLGARLELVMLRQGKAVRDAEGWSHPKADAMLDEYERRFGHLLSPAVTDAAAVTYWTDVPRKRRPRARAYGGTGTAAQRAVARRLLSARGIPTGRVNRMSRADLGAIIGRLR